MSSPISQPPVTTSGRHQLPVYVSNVDPFPEVPLIAISDSRRRWNPSVNWVVTIHHGLDVSRTPASALPGGCLVMVGQ